jgi:hypothetical protein
MLRTKLSHVNEGGVAAGLGALVNIKNNLIFYFISFLQNFNYNKQT